MKKVKINALSLKDIERKLAEVQRYRDSLERKLDSLLTALAEQGTIIAKNNISAYHMPWATGELENSIQGIYDSNTGKGAIWSDSDHAVYVEFGTGIVGKNSPHSESGTQGYQYDVNNHGDSGWWYLKDEDGNFHWTKGMPSRPFMWTTANRLREMLPSMAKQAFKS